MKKNTQRIITLIAAALSALLIIALLVLILSPAAAANANNPLVQVLVYILASVLLIAVGLSVFMVFLPDNRVKKIKLQNSNRGKSDVTAACVKRVAKEAASSVEGAFIKKIKLTKDAFDEIYFSASLLIEAKKYDGEIAVSSDFQEKPGEIIKKVTAAIELEVMEIFGLEFRAIELKLVDAKYYGMPTADMIGARIAGAPLISSTAVTLAAREQACLERELACLDREKICSVREVRLATIGQDVQEREELLDEAAIAEADLAETIIDQVETNHPKNETVNSLPIVIPCSKEDSY